MLECDVQRHGPFCRHLALWSGPAKGCFSRSEQSRRWLPSVGGYTDARGTRSDARKQERTRLRRLVWHAILQRLDTSSPGCQRLCRGVNVDVKVSGKLVVRHD